MTTTCGTKQVLVKKDSINKVLDINRNISFRTGEAYWNMEQEYPQRFVCNCQYMHFFDVEAMPDDILKPLGNPGEGEKDETLLWAPTPKKKLTLPKKKKPEKIS